MNTNNTEPDYVNISRYARHYRISRTTVYKLIKNGKILTYYGMVDVNFVPPVKKTKSS